MWPLLRMAARAGIAQCDRRAVCLGVFVFPIWAAFLLLNLIWGAFIIVRQRWQGGILWLTPIPVWLVAMAIDFAHH